MRSALKVVRAAAALVVCILFAASGAAAQRIDVPVGAVPAGAVFTVRYRITITSAQQIGPTLVANRAFFACSGCAQRQTQDSFIVPDTIAPPVPVFESPAEAAFVNTPSPALRGTGEPGSLLSVLRAGQVVSTAEVDGSGRWEVLLPFALNDGVHALSVQSKDAAGNIGPESALRSFTVDTVAPTVPIITFPLTAHDFIDPTPLVAGVSEPGSQVTILVDGIVLGAGFADATGRYFVETTSRLGFGLHRFSAVATDAAGNAGGAAPEVFASLRPVLETDGHFFWNRFLALENVLALRNPEDLPVSGTIYLLDANGDQRSSIPFVVPPNRELTVPLAPFLAELFDTIGTARVTFDLPGFDMYGEIYRRGPGRERYEIIASAAGEQIRRGRSALLVNTFVPDVAAVGPAGDVAEWIQIANADQEDWHRFHLDYFDDRGVLIAGADVDVPPLGRADVQGGHELLGSPRAASVVVTPDADSTPYVVTSGRYYRVVDGAGRAFYRYAVYGPASAGDHRAQWLTISGPPDSGGWFVLYNASDDPGLAVVRVAPGDGLLHASAAIPLAPREQLHYPLAALTGGGTLTAIEISSPTGTPLVGEAHNYIFDKERRFVTGVVASRARGRYGAALSGGFRTDRGYRTRLQLFNVQSVPIKLTLRVQKAHGTFATRDIFLLPYRGLDLALEKLKTSLPQRSAGIIAVDGPPDAFAADLRREIARDGRRIYDASVLPVR